VLSGLASGLALAAPIRCAAFRTGIHASVSYSAAARGPCEGTAGRLVRAVPRMRDGYRLRPVPRQRSAAAAAPEGFCPEGAAKLPPGSGEFPGDLGRPRPITFPRFSPSAVHSCVLTLRPRAPKVRP